MKLTRLTMLLLLGMTAVALAGSPPSGTTDLDITRIGNNQMLTGKVWMPGKTLPDTIYLLGGPDRNDGKFQDDVWGSFPDPEGWYGVDLTQRTEPIWHIATYNAAELDPEVVPNHAMWCGEDFPSCGFGDPEGGYGNGYNEYLDWYGIVPNPSGTTSVNVKARLNHDIEIGYDYLMLRFERAGGDMETVQFWTGDNRQEGHFVPLDVDVTFNVESGDYVGPGNDQIHLRWHLTSDAGVSDGDCYYPSAGAAQIDNLVVSFNGTPWAYDNFEPGGWINWQVEFPEAVGNFAWTWPELEDMDPCRENRSPQWAFIDDGLVVEGTGGYTCTSWCYGPGGFIVNPVGGLAGPESHIHNEVWSPVIEWPAAGFDGALFEFDVYTHETFETTASPGMLYMWHVRSTADPTGLSGWTGWADRNFGYYGGPVYGRHHEIVTDLLVPDPEFVQLALGVIELGYTEGFEGTDGTPAPYFDNVALMAYEFGGAAIATREIDLAQDDFPEIGTFDFDNLAANSVRFDMATNISPPDDLRNDPGDSIVFDVAPVRSGSVLNGPPKLHYKMKANPVFDLARSTGLPNEGIVLGDSARTSGGTVVPDRWFFDLPDTGFFFPGDVIHYFITAEDNLAGDIATTILPGDTTGFSFFPGDEGFLPMRYPSQLTVKALPSFHTFSEAQHPPILLVNDFGSRGGENEWGYSLHLLGFTEGVDFDLYHVNGPSSGVGNGIGGRANANQLKGYRSILYTSGDLRAFTIGNGDFAGDPSDDVNVFDTWLRYGEKNLLLSGDSVVFDLHQSGTQTLNFSHNWLSVNLVGPDVRSEIEFQAAPLVRAVPGNPVFNQVQEWFAYGGCYLFNTFDALIVNGSAQKLADYTDPNREFTPYDYAAAVLNHELEHDNNIIILPYDFMFIYSPGIARGPFPPEGKVGSPKKNRDFPTRITVMDDILSYFGHLGSSSPVTDVPETRPFQVKNYPNPFNPSTTIEYYLPNPGPLSIKIFNVRGELVRTLVNGPVPAGPGSVLWEGTDHSGATVASGVYFFETRAAGEVRINKLALVK